eukprot:171841_1
MSKFLITSKTPKRKTNSIITRLYLKNLEKTEENKIINTNKSITKKKSVQHSISKPFEQSADKNVTNYPVTEIENILDHSNDINGYKVVTEQEFKLISDLNEKESKLINSIKSYENAHTSTKQ